MLTKDTLITGEETRNRLINGIWKCRNAVGGTMGTGGANSILEAMEMPGHRVTNDGATILDAIRLADPVEEMGRKILLEAVSRSNKASGDGSSTTTVLTAAILEEGMKHITEASPMEIKTSLEACIPLIEESIKKQKREISVDELAPVAAISAEDETIGAKIQEIYQYIGRKGIVHWDVSKTGEDYYTIGTGITVEGAGYVSPYMCDVDTNGNPTNSIRLNSPKVLVLRQKIASAEEFNTLASGLNNKGIKELVVFCDDIDPLVIPSLVMTRMQRGFRIIVIKLPTYFKDEWFVDLAKASGATLVDAGAGMALKDATMEHLGTFGNIIVTKEDTYIDGIADLTEYTKALEEEATEASLLRSARLNTKTARYYVGGLSDSAISHRRYKVEDAIAAAYHALNGGIVAGGGVAISQAVNDLDDKTVGEKILRQALYAPLNQIAKNAGIEPYIGFTNNKGKDTRTKETVDMFEAHITDPATIVLNSVKNAISVAASVLTCNTLVLLPRESVDNSSVGMNTSVNM